jgi:hypothetical protein
MTIDQLPDNDVYEAILSWLLAQKQSISDVCAHDLRAYEAMNPRSLVIAIVFVYNTFSSGRIFKTLKKKA